MDGRKEFGIEVRRHLFAFNSNACVKCATGNDHAYFSTLFVDSDVEDQPIVCRW